MGRNIWQPQLSHSHSDEQQRQPEQRDSRQLRRRPGRERGRLFALISRPFDVVRRGLGATANGVSTAVQRPVRAARAGLRRDGAHVQAAAPPQPGPVAKKQTPWEGLVVGVRDKIDEAKELIPRSQATSQQLLKRCFPARLSHSSGSGAAAFMGSWHDLAASGERVFGLSVARAKLQVRIYEFAVYFDAKQAKASQLAKRHQRALAPASQPAVAAQTSSSLPAQQRDQFADALRSSPDIDMSLVVRASRNLPLGLMRAEYERILKRRLKAVGGSAEDPALHQLLDSFREEHLPSHMVQNGNVRRDSVLAFTRTSGGRVTATADGAELATVTSPAFAAAVFDLYLGSQPVNGDARAAALESATRMMLSGAEGYQPTPGLPGVCERSAEGGACRAPRMQPWQHIFQPQPTG